MIVTRSWLDEWIDLSDITTEDIAKTFNSIGLEVDRVHKYRVPSKIVFGKVLECKKHPDADKLNICQVDVGSDVRQIVCGAANVRAGLDVVVATVGAVMPSGLAIKPVKLRGVASDGMICSAGEIGLPDIGKGIMELDATIGSYTIGQEVSENPILNDDLIEIELTANRGDCLSIRGVARDLSAAFDRPIKEYVATGSDEKRGVGRILSLSHEKSLSVNLRYKAVDLKGLSLPLLVILRLAQIEERRESDLGSLLYYVTHTSGVILRAYRRDFFVSDQEDSLAKLIIGEDVKEFACVKSSTGKIASIIGVNQSDDSKENGNNGIIFLEASYIPPEIISKKMADSKRDADEMFYRTSRGSEPELENGLSFCVDLLESCSSSTSYSGSVEYIYPFQEKIVKITKHEIDTIIGANIERSLIAKIMKNLGFDTSKSSPDVFVIRIPQFRHDIVNKQDIVEEIVRMVGIDNIPAKPFLLAEENRLEDNYFEYKKRSIYRHRAAQSGFFESVHFIFDEKKVLQEYGFETTKENLELLNPIVQTLDTLRPTLLTGLLKAASQNVKNGYSAIALFEIGSVFTPLREESLNAAFLMSGNKEHESITNGGRPSEIDFAYFTQKIADIVGDIELKEYKTIHKFSHPYQTAQVFQNGIVLGELFRLHPEVEKVYGLPNTFLCELDFSKLSYGLKIVKKRSKYQASFRDLSLLIPKDMPYEKMKNLIESSEIPNLIRFYPVDRYTDEELGDAVSLSIRFVLQSDEKTLEEDDITAVMDKILEELDAKLGIGLR
ncbi:Phenylalanyl-tRNA synthetase beta chain [hydrothermal vent metagenome]|uniref:Phenylalanine--tRNA ligase beta subunit n=1 Tax=hydrothermal vent metagenome TaxID=652676 RepID=A0A1W1BTW1_9ZZZZ